jgi:hypothetical protein
MLVCDRLHGAGVHTDPAEIVVAVQTREVMLVHLQMVLFAFKALDNPVYFASPYFHQVPHFTTHGLFSVKFFVKSFQLH